MSNTQTPVLDALKLYENAKASIQLGIEDFQLSQKSILDGGNPARALSSVRNLFAGMLLIFKYKIADSVDTPQDAYNLIHLPPHKILPKPDGSGGILWEPEGKFNKVKTIDVQEIADRFATFDIEVDWDVIVRLQKCRNHLEHLHPQNTLGELAGFVADLFPVLTSFITDELGESPQDMLGEAWNIMLEHQTFYNHQMKECELSWAEAGVPNGMMEYLESSVCEDCGSRLIKASPKCIEQGLTVESNDDAFEYRCISCGHSSLITPQLMEAFEHEFFYWPPDGEEPTYEHCYCCDRETFVINEAQCRWCEHELEHSECTFCEEPLSQDDQINGGLCGSCNHRFYKDD
ncbi:hypothetical protein ABKV41_20675 [Enterobacter roggenkampii]|uniref:hypothetical protein n=1 Tax=Enterobacter roggenkampii TaxID=1812935 RepID=UPI0032AF8D71